MLVILLIIIVIRLPQAWSLLEALSAHGEPTDDLEKLLLRMSVPEKRVWLTRRLAAWP